MNLPLRTWTLTADALPERLLGAQEDTGFTLPGADALAAFAGLLGVEEEKAPAAKELPGAPFDLPALIPQDVEGCFTLSREIDFGELAGDRAELRPAHTAPSAYPALEAYKKRISSAKQKG